MATERKTNPVLRAETSANDLRALARLAELDGLLGERHAVRRGMIRRQATQRSELGSLSARIEAQKRLLTAVEARLGGDADNPSIRSHRESLAKAEARYSELVRDLEQELRRVEPLRVKLQEEMRTLEEKREKALEELSPHTRSLYESLVQEGRVPVIASPIDGVCSGCQCSLSSRLAEEIRRGEIRMCPGCQRLLYRWREA